MQEFLTFVDKYPVFAALAVGLFVWWAHRQKSGSLKNFSLGFRDVNQATMTLVFWASMVLMLLLQARGGWSAGLK